MAGRDDRSYRGSGSRRTASSGSSYPGNGYYRRKRKRERERRKRLLVGGLVAVLVLIFLVIGLKKVIRSGGSGSGSDKNLSGTASEMTTTVPETELKRAVTINDVDITGMTREEAKKAVLKKFSWGMTAKLAEADEKDEAYVVSDLLSAKLEKVLDRIYDSGKNAQDSYELNAEDLDDEIAAEAAAMASKWNRKAKNGAVSGYDKEKKSFSYSDSQTGRTVDQKAAADEIRTAMNEKNYGAEITVKADIVQPELTAAQAKEKYKVIGTYTTKATANADRNNNLKLACEAIDGKILQVGDEFSFNHTTGNRTEERGYKAAGAYRDGKVIQEPGGGVCQVSTTLYNAVVMAGITPTERHAHTFEPSYVTPGEDAAVSYDGYDGPDFKFTNNTESAIAIRANFYDRTVTVSVVGLPILEDGVTISMKSTKTEEFDNGGVEYVDDTTLEPGVEKVLSDGSMGSRWSTNLITKKNGEVISDVFFHNSTYKGHSKTIARNPGTVVTSTAAETSMIVENTETAAEQKGNSATEAGSVAAENTVAPKPGETKTETKAQTTAASPTSSTVSSNGPGSSSTETVAAPAPTAPAPTAAAPTTAAAPAPTAAPVGPGGSSSASPAPTEETVAPFPGA